MNNNDNSGSFWGGVIVAVIAMLIFYHPQTKVEDKTAQEWKDAYDVSQQTVQDWEKSYKAVGDCLSSENGNWNYGSATYSYESYAWIYSGYNASSYKSPTEKMNDCFTNNSAPSSSGYFSP